MNSELLAIRLLTETDWQAYKSLRLSSLQNNPDSYLSTYDNEVHQTDSYFRYVLHADYRPPHFGYFGYFENQKLVAYVQLIHNTFPKQQHTGRIYNLTVQKKLQGKGIGRQLMNHVLQQAQQAGLEIVFLSCLSDNIPAQKLYESLGFELCGRRPNYVLWNDQYQDSLNYCKKLTS